MEPSQVRHAIFAGGITAIASGGLEFIVNGELTPLIAGLFGVLAGGVYLTAVLLLPKWRNRWGFANSVDAGGADHHWHVPEPSRTHWMTLPVRRIMGSRGLIWAIGGVLATLILTALVLLVMPLKAGVDCLKVHMPQVSWAIDEKDPQHLYDELKVLYPRLEKCGLLVPMLEPRQIGDIEYDGTWFGFHKTALKVLFRKMRNETINIDGWNNDFSRENAKRNRVMKAHSGGS